VETKAPAHADTPRASGVTSTVSTAAAPLSVSGPTRTSAFSSVHSTASSASCASATAHATSSRSSLASRTNQRMTTALG
jgi:hypothetical protein